MKTEKEIEDMISDVMLESGDYGFNNEDYENGYIAALEWVLNRKKEGSDKP